MISELIKNNFGAADKEDLSCAEKILIGANREYNLGLTKESLRLAAGLSGGAYSGKLCGALSGGALVLASLFIKERAHEDKFCGNLIEELISRYEVKMESADCISLKKKHRTEEEGCKNVILVAAEILDDIILREWDNRKN